MIGQDRTGWDKIVNGEGQYRIGQDRTGQDGIR